MEWLARDRVERAPAEVARVLEELASGGRVVEGQLVLVRDQTDRAAGFPADGERGRVDPVAVDKQPACGPEQATMAAQLLFRGWSPVLRGEPLAGAASRPKKSFSGFLER